MIWECVNVLMNVRVLLGQDHSCLRSGEVSRTRSIPQLPPCRSPAFRGKPISMVWRKKKEQVTHPKLTSSAGAPGAVARAVDLPTDRLAVATAQNQDNSHDDWNPDTREFTIPVRITNSKRPYTLPRNYRISGDLASDRQVIVQGEFLSGFLNAPMVLVAPGGVVRDNLTAANLRVAGTVDAVANIGVCVEISGRGCISGTIKAPAIKAAPGARLDGCQLQITQN